MIYHSVTLDPTATNTTTQNGHKLPVYHVESMGDLPIRKMTQKFARNPNQPPEETVHKVCFFMAQGKIRVDYHRDPGKLTYNSITYFKDEKDNNKLKVAKGGPQPTQVEIQRLLQMEKACRDTIDESHQRMLIELVQRRKDETNIRAARSNHAGEGAKRDLITISQSR